MRRIRREPALAIRIALAFATVIVFSAVHITGMVGLRKLIMWLAGGAYDFRFSLATVLYEFRKDAVTCVLIGGGMWLIDSRREAQRALQVDDAARAGGAASRPRRRRSGCATARAASASSRARSSGSVSAGNYVEYSLADGTNHLIRGTLAAAESQLSRFNLARIHRTRLANLDRITGRADRNRQAISI